MSGFGWILVILALPLFIGYGLSDRKNRMWLRLGLLMAGVSLVIVLLGALLT